MKYYFKLIFVLFLLFNISNVYAEPANDMFLDDNLYKCIIDAYNKENHKSANYTYDILPEQLVAIKTLDCSKYKGKIEDLTGLNLLTGLTSLNLSGNTFLGGSIKITGNPLTLKSNISLPNSITITDKKYIVEDTSIVKVNNGVVTPLANGSTYVTMTGKVTGNEIVEKYLVSVSSPKFNLNSNSKLSSLYLSKGEFKFDSDVKSYATIVDNSVTSVNVVATVADKRAKFVTNYGPRTVTLKTGTNIIEVKVEAEDKTTSTYVISVIRSDGNDNNNRLANIELTVGKINFNPDVYTYSFGVASNVNEIDVKAVAESPLSTVEITDIAGNTKKDKISSKLKVGSNKITISVNSESNKPQQYQLIITREDYESEDNYLSSLKIDGYDINFKRDVYKYEVNIKNEKALNISAIPEKGTATYNIVDNTDLQDGSNIKVIVKDEEGSPREYNILVHKSSTFDFSNILIKWIALALELLIILILIIVIISRKSNRPRRPKKMKVSEPKPVKKPTNTMTMGNSSSITCKACGTVNDIKSKTCYVCGNQLK